MSKHAQHTPWWQDAVIYQVYPRSFADADANGMGDLRGVASKIGYLKKLGVNAVWLSPFYKSPQADAGYDVADYRQVDPLFGTLEDFDDMLARAHAEDIRIIVDLVPNHTSDEHVWFGQALAAAPGSPERDRYIFRDGQGPAGDVEPNNWQSLFGGPAWTRTTNADGSPGQWYLHLFDTKQPDLNWENEEVHAEMRSVLRFWLDRGVDGFRVDVAHGMVKAEGLPDWSEKVSMVQGNEEAAASATPPYFDQEGVHAIYEEWNAVLAEYDGDRMMVAEAWVEPMERIFRYVRAGEMQQAFNFGFLLAGWNARNIVENVTETLAEAAVVAAPPTWVLSNHDTVRHCSRFGLTDPTSFPKGIAAQDEQPDEALGAARGRAAALIMFALPGSAYIYQGDELTLPEHTTLPDQLRQDPSFFRTEGAERGRDGCRIPMPWAAGEEGLGFSPVNHDAGTQESGAAEPWLPQPESYTRYAADQQVGVEGSAFELYRSLLSHRAERELGRGQLDWAPANAPSEGVLSYTNGTLQVLANLGTKPVEVPAGMSVLAASAPEVCTDDGLLKPDAALWLVPEQ
ncbi:MAG: glycoside hydrolase family 13 protein [Micrococcaceae bacterium]|uniref:glycoside hydrolase family 13 protein n=1 Tax=Arthrobacter sp. AOP36-C1-22 TaxID=3457683 RepID=UPI00265402B1|nr:glycoside hydrolase family 13 protein [Micrococcaceae bacterium]MDN5824856.1 glycoside hydrolase family 13 protein [Micrococcaceae bacterium]MDN5877985.1 glycoside hydrolase family 13 protein [Micrococcaceae bacterium]MDN5885503.1 glycoside hydrolase family 13 protein [Micrococcaceae bacterium]MDN5905081.1 glycoside hydrolase family 13 protein [Micrococcaceae bacterium]